MTNERDRTRVWSGRRGLLSSLAVMTALAGCAAPQTSQPTSAPTYDTTVARPIQPRDAFERAALERGADMKLIDRLTDERTRVPPYDRQPPPDFVADLRIDANTALRSDDGIFSAPEPLDMKPATVRLGIARSTYRTREPQEALSAVLPLFDLEQRQVNVRAEATVYQRGEECYFGLLDSKEQMVISHVFDYLLARSWMSAIEGNGTVLLGHARPAYTRSTDLDARLAGVAGTSVELIVSAGSGIRTFADLKGKRISLAANDSPAVGTFLAGLLRESGQPRGEAYFAGVTLRRFLKDCVIDVLKGKADAACVDQGTLGAIERFYGITARSPAADGETRDAPLRIIAVSPRYNLDVLYSSVNNLATHRTEIELTQRQLTTLRKDPEGQEVLFFFNQEAWQYADDAAIRAAEAAYGDFLLFYEQTPLDLKPLLDPKAAVDRRTYDRFGDE